MTAPTLVTYSAPIGPLLALEQAKTDGILAIDERAARLAYAARAHYAAQLELLQEAREITRGLTFLSSLIGSGWDASVRVRVSSGQHGLEAIERLERAGLRLEPVGRIVNNRAYRVTR